MCSTNLGETGTEAGEHLPHVASFLHGDHAQVVLLVHPHQERLVIVVPEDKVKISLFQNDQPRGRMTPK